MNILNTLLIIFSFVITGMGLTILHISDIHYDASYSIGSPGNCLTESYGLRCCRKDSIPKNPWHPASIYGELNCDSPFQLANKTFKYITNNLHIDLILWTGDSTDHHFFTQSEENVLKEIADMTSLILFYFKDIPVIPVLGNHDSYLLDQYNPEMIPKIYSLWKQWVPKEFLIDGHYTVSYSGQVGAKEITFTAINSLVYDIHNIFNQTEAVGRLYDYLAKNQGNWLVGHIPPGAGEAGYNFTEFINTLNFTTSFWGHSHSDQIRLNSRLVMYITPSLLPDSHYPEFRTYNITEGISNGLVEDYTVYMSSLDSWDYTILYSAKKDYNLSDLSYDSWINFSKNIQKDQLLLDRYYYNTGPPFNNNSCDTACMKGLLSDMLI